jgi:hypothetical protein
MAANTHTENQKVIHFIQQVPYSDEEKAAWVKTLEEGEVNEILLNELHTALMAIPAEKFANDWMRAKYSTDLAGIMRQWRLKNARLQFKHGRKQ